MERFLSSPNGSSSAASLCSAAPPACNGGSHNRKKRSVCDISGSVEQPASRRKEQRLTPDWFASCAREPSEVEGRVVDDLGCDLQRK